MKRIELFLRAVAIVARRFPDLRATIVGDGPLRESLEHRAREPRIAARARFVGHRKDVERWLSPSNVFVLTSDSEGLPLSAMEALACGLPAVAARVGELPDLVEDGVNGSLVASREPAELADRIILALDPARWQHLPDATRYTARRHDVAAATRGSAAILLAR